MARAFALYFHRLFNDSAEVQHRRRVSRQNTRMAKTNTSDFQHIAYSKTDCGLVGAAPRLSCAICHRRRRTYDLGCRGGRELFS